MLLWHIALWSTVLLSVGLAFSTDSRVITARAYLRIFMRRKFRTRKVMQTVEKDEKLSDTESEAEEAEDVPP